MVSFNRLSRLVLVALAANHLSFAMAADFTVNISATPSHPIPETLFGYMYEDISHSGDGGLYAELLQNRAFQMVTPGAQAALNAWIPSGSSNITVVKSSTPVSSALPNALSLAVPSGATGPVGFSNLGYFGLKVDKSWTYTATFFVRFPSATRSTRSKITVGLSSIASGAVFGSSTIDVTVPSDPTKWTELTTKLRPSHSATDTNNTFTVSVDGATFAGQTLEFAMFSLMPPTFKNRPNGMRIDIAETLASAKPAFFRFPGGNNLEGPSTSQRWQWNNTVGSLVDRPGRVGDWGYVNTDGLGLLEYMTWLEDVGMTPIMAVWAGFSLDGDSLPEVDLTPFIQQSIDQINFVTGDASESEPAALRAKLGHPEPFELRFVEIGNEDFFATSSYAGYRWSNYSTTLKAAFPNITFLATSTTFTPPLSPNPQAWDVHVYQTPDWFRENAFIYDGFERNGTIYFEGEYAAISTNPNDIFGSPADGRLTFPTIQSATGEAAFMTGLERNADIVFAASYAPLLNHVANSQWTPNLVSFTADQVIPSTSFYVQKAFSLSKGDSYLPSTLPVQNGTVFWSVTRDSKTKSVFIKISNTAAAASTLTFNVPFRNIGRSGQGSVMTSANASDSNTPDAPNSVVPQPFSFTPGKSFTYNAPGLSFTVLEFTAS